MATKELELETAKVNTLKMILKPKKTKPILLERKNLLKNNMATTKESFAKIEAHERECTIRYENIEKRLDQGQIRFNKLENMIWGLYVLLIASGVLAGMFG
tara:strand:- start:367 stop:669 length:303 start_codon:yes stop_codon:yes gene_type:complete